jgi:transcriptional regulator with XRE-family HTH domain
MHTMDIHERLKMARAKAGYVGPAEAARALGVNRITYSQHESGIRGINKSNAARYARFFRVDLVWLLTGKGKPQRNGHIPIIGYVGAGAEVYPIDDHALGAALDQIDITETFDNLVGLTIRGESMYPFRDGWILFYRRDQYGVPASCFNELCVCQVANNGPLLIKQLRKGTTPNRFTLESWNASAREDIELEWAAPVLIILPR